MCPKIEELIETKHKPYINSLAGANYPQKINYMFFEKFRNPFKNFSTKYINNAFHQPPLDSFHYSRPRLLYSFRLSKKEDKCNNASIISMLVKYAFDIGFTV